MVNLTIIYLMFSGLICTFAAISRHKDGSVRTVPGRSSGLIHIKSDGDDTILGSDIIQDPTVNAIDQKTIVDKHNALRRQVANGQEKRGSPGPQPAASNLRQMRWDANLAKAAQTLTNRCIFSHDVGILAGTWKTYGQNLAAGNYGSWNNVIQAWYNEVSQYPSNKVGSYVFKAGHYSQVVWADSYAVGCGVTKCPSGLSPIYVCNYGPPGNYVGSAMYKTGSAASACPSGTVANSGLCS